MYDKYTGYTIDYNESDSFHWHDHHIETPEEAKRFHDEWERRKTDPAEIKLTQDKFDTILRGFHKQWHRDATPPEKRDRAFYDSRMLCFFGNMMSLAERSPCVSRQEYKRLLNMYIHYDKRLNGEDNPYI